MWTGQHGVQEIAGVQVSMEAPAHDRRPSLKGWRRKEGARARGRS
jgi:hypothetical protein